MRVNLNLNFWARSLCAMRLGFEVIFLSSFSLAKPVKDGHHFLSISICLLTFLPLYVQKASNKPKFLIPSKPIYLGIIYTGILTHFFEVCQTLKAYIIHGDKKKLPAIQSQEERNGSRIDWDAFLKKRGHWLFHIKAWVLSSYHWLSSSLFSNP